MTAGHLFSVARTVTLVVVVVLAQVSLFSDLSFFGVRPEIPLLVAVAAGVAGGPDRGAMVGFAVGLFYDLFLQTPLGLSALVYTVVAYVVGTVQLQLSVQTRLVRAGSVALASGAGILAWAGLGDLVDQVDVAAVPLLRVVVIAGLLNGLVGLPASRVLAWAFAPRDTPRVRA